MIAFSILDVTLFFYTYSLAINNVGLLRSYGFSQPSNFISLVIFLQIYELVAYFYHTILTNLSRRNEFQADQFAKK